MNIRDLQRALRREGFDPGPIDGVWGRRSISALKAFQESRGLTVDGILSPTFLHALRATSRRPIQEGDPTPNMPRVWYQEALRQLGTREAPGPASNPKIVQWAGALGIRYRGDDIPWCGLFVAHCIGSTLTGEPLPNNPLGARTWARFGKRCQPALGAVLVFWRGSRNGALGHVGFYHGEDDVAFRVLGGNQSDRVCVARVAKDRLLAVRQPSTVAELASGPVHLTRTGEPLSDNEA